MAHTLSPRRNRVPSPPAPRAATRTAERFTPDELLHVLENQRAALRCGRCAGMRVPELMSEGGIRVPALRCIHCGDLVDSVILLNRRHRRLAEPRRTRTPRYVSTVCRGASR
jgi:hypothetical protein